MSKLEPSLTEANLKKLQSFFLWLRLAAVLPAVSGLWQVFIGLGLFVNLRWVGIYQLLIGSCLLWLGWILWQASRDLTPITLETEDTKLTYILLQIAERMELFFKLAVIFVVAVAVSILIFYIVAGFIVIT